jgi:proline iminopeptidase
MCSRRRILSCIPLLFVLSSSLFPQSFSEGRDGYVEVTRAKLYYIVVGTGEPIVVIHGGPGLDHNYLVPQMNVLARTHKLIYYDQRASGKSTGTVDSMSITPDQFVEDLERLRETLGIEKMNLLGHSWGGLLAMEYAIKYPQHMKSMVLMNSMGAMSDCMAPFIKTRIERTTHDDSLSMERILSSPEWAAHDPKAVGEYLCTVFRTYFFDRRFADSLNMNLNQNTAIHFLPIFGLMGKYLNHYDISRNLDRITCPTLIITGDYDPFPVNFSKEISLHIKNSQFVQISHCGHFPYIECPEEIIRACTGFWDTLPR